MVMNTPLYRIWDKHKQLYRKYYHYATPCGAVFVLEYINGEWIVRDQLCQEDYIVERYTGLKDIDGNWIYEGDRVSYNLTTHRSDTITEHYEATVLFRNGEFRPRSMVFDCEDEYYSYEINNLKIIGNIHDKDGDE